MITDEMLFTLRGEIQTLLSHARYLHTLGVERAALEIGKHCLSDKLSDLSAAALLHDIAKEIPVDAQLKLMHESGIAFTEEDYRSESLYHAFCAPQIVKEKFPSFATEAILSAVFLHTSGGENMTLFDEIIFLADFVEDGRKYDSCKEIREELF